MKCPKCGSENVTINMPEVKLKRKAIVWDIKWHIVQ